MGASVPYYATAEFMAGKRVTIKVYAVTSEEADREFSKGHWEIVEDNDDMIVAKRVVSDWETTNDN